MTNPKKDEKYESDKCPHKVLKAQKKKRKNSTVGSSQITKVRFLEIFKVTDF